MTIDRLRIVVEAHEGQQPFVLHVEPWGPTFDIAHGSPAVVTFTGGDGLRPSISVGAGPDHVVVCAEDGIDNYRVEDSTGPPLTGR